jgi:hypothetical protein
MQRLTTKVNIVLSSAIVRSSSVRHRFDRPVIGFVLLMDESRDFSTNLICAIFSDKPSVNIGNYQGRQILRFHRAPRLTSARFLIFFEELVASLFDHLLLYRRKSGLSVSNLFQNNSKNRIAIQCLDKYDMSHAVEENRSKAIHRGHGDGLPVLYGSESCDLA